MMLGQIKGTAGSMHVSHNQHAHGSMFISQCRVSFIMHERGGIRVRDILGGHGLNHCFFLRYVGAYLGRFTRSLESQVTSIANHAIWGGGGGPAPLQKYNFILVNF